MAKSRIGGAEEWHCCEIGKALRYHLHLLLIHRTMEEVISDCQVESHAALRRIQRVAYPPAAGGQRCPGTHPHNEVKYACDDVCIPQHQHHQARATDSSLHSEAPKSVRPPVRVTR